MKVKVSLDKIDINSGYLRFNHFLVTINSFLLFSLSDSNSQLGIIIVIINTGNTSLRTDPEAEIVTTLLLLENVDVVHETLDRILDLETHVDQLLGLFFTTSHSFIEVSFRHCLRLHNLQYIIQRPLQIK